VAATWTNGPDGSVVRVAVQERNDRLHLSIRDDGVAAPIPPAARV
jgi:signal transduction histidine kinase